MIAIFDVEGVLVDGEFLPELARLVGKEEEVREITLKGIRGEISWEHGLARRIDLVKVAKHGFGIAVRSRKDSLCYCLCPLASLIERTVAQSVDSDSRVAMRAAKIA